MNRISPFSLIALLVLCLTACKKDRENRADVLSGEWQEIGLGSISRRLGFANGKDFTFTVTPDMKINSSTIFSGVYSVKEDSLKVKINKVVPPEGADVVASLDKPELYEQATFSIKSDTLTLRYISYPADAPVNTVSKFKKLLPFGDDMKR